MRKLAPFVLVFGLVGLVAAQDGPPTNNANIMTRVDTDNHLVVAAEIRDPNTTTQKAAVSASGALKVECASGCSGGASFADNSAFTFGTTNINPTGYVFDDVAPNAVTENNAAAPRMSGNRVPYAILRDAAGNERGVNVTAGNALTVDGSAVTQPISGTVTANQGGTWTVQPGNTQNTTPWLVKEIRAASATTTQVPDTASSTMLLAANSNRLGASIVNDSSAVLYVKFGTTASATDYTVRLVRDAYYEVPNNYTGRIDGIWATDPGDGAARITEMN